MTAAFAFVFRDSTLTITEVHVRFLAPEIAVAHVRWSMIGAKTPQGIPEPREGIQTQILQKKAGRWFIATFQNTNAVPEVPMLEGPPGTPPKRSSGTTAPNVYPFRNGSRSTEAGKEQRRAEGPPVRPPRV